MGLGATVWPIFRVQVVSGTCIPDKSLFVESLPN